MFIERRGADEDVGTFATDPKDFFKLGIGNEDTLSIFKKRYDAAYVGLSAAAYAAFDDEKVMQNRTNATMWLNENKDSPCALRSAHAAIMAIGN